MTDTLMACGHVAQGIMDNSPACVICWPAAGSLIVADKPPLEGRFAKCAYNNSNDRYPEKHKHEPIPSDYNLAFFEFRGEGSYKAGTMCAICNYSINAPRHGDSWRKYDPKLDGEKHEFVPRGAYEFDEYYCGCWGWD